MPAGPIAVRYHDTGHLLGSSMIEVEVRQGDRPLRIVFSGDVGRYDAPLYHDPQRPPDCDYLICESTYGDRDHPEAGATWKELLGHVQRVCVEQHGRLIIPAFSVGRTQEILYALNHLFNEGKLPRVPVFVDSPLSINATGIYRKHSDLLQADIRKELETDPDLFGFQGVEFIREAWRSKELNTRKGPSITIAASGMMDAGRIRHHLLHGLPDANNAVLIVGFCAPGTFGERLLQRPETVKLYGEVVPVRAAILSMDSYSAHGDRNELLRWIACQEPTLVKHVFLVHGSDHALEGLRDRYAEHGFRDIQIPELGQRFEV